MKPTMALPSGQVTFLMTDIESSTDLLRQLGEQVYAQLVFRHREHLSEAVRAQGGVIFGTEGDACFCAFPEAADALWACVEAQRLLAAEPWPQQVRPQVRMGLHSGEAQPYADNYVALAVHQAARVAAAGHGGQILVSAQTAALASPALPEGVSLRDLGSFRLRDFPEPQRLFQLLHADLPQAFPPPRSLTQRSHNLPRAASSFIGRSSERQQLAQALRQHRLVTLSGPGGVGKTRLALEVAGQLLPHFGDGVWLVELATVRGLDGLVRACAFALGVAEEPGRSLLESVVSHLETRSLLLILDNGEHLLADCSALIQQLGQPPGLRLLLTSREPLRLAQEHCLRVAPLPVADSGEGLSEAARLFVERVQQQRPDFRLDPRALAAINDIVRRLDGVPLALELAASRVRALPLQELASRLSDRFRLLAGGARDGASRHQTLRATVEWSYELLTPAERSLFERLSVFSDGWDLEAAETVCADEQLPAAEMLDLLTALVDKSLVTYAAQFGETRYGMLETLRDFAHEKLRTGDGSAVQRRLLGWALTLAESAVGHYAGADGAAWMARLLGEQANLRTALELGHQLGAQREVLRLTAALTHFWIKRGRLREGLQWCERALALPAGDNRVRCQLLMGHGRLLRGADPRKAERLLWQALELARSLRDPALQLEALKQLTTAVRDRGDYDAAEGYLNEQLRLLEAARDAYRSFVVETELATLALQQGRVAEAAARLQRQLQQAEQAHWHYDRARLSNNLAIALIELGDYAAARTLAAEGAERFRELGSLEGVSHLLSTGGMALLREGDLERARRQFIESGRIALEIGASHLAPEALERLAAVEQAAGRAEASARLLYAADALYLAVGYTREPADQQLREDLDGALQAALGAPRCRQLAQEAARQAKQVLGEALGAQPGPAFPDPPAGRPGGAPQRYG